MVISCRATRRSPLRSKRAMISPVRFREKASGLTRMSVRSTAAGLLHERGTDLVRRRALCNRLLGAVRAPARTTRRRGGRPDLGLAEGADLPRRVQRPPPRVARALE